MDWFLICLSGNEAHSILSLFIVQTDAWVVIWILLHSKSTPGTPANNIFSTSVTFRTHQCTAIERESKCVFAIFLSVYTSELVFVSTALSPGEVHLGFQVSEDRGIQKQRLASHTNSPHGLHLSLLFGGLQYSLDTRTLSWYSNSDNWSLHWRLFLMLVMGSV